MDRQDEVFMRLKNQPLKNFGRREINVIFGSSREITKVGVSSYGQVVYRFESDAGSIMFYFNGREIKLIG